MCVHKKELKRLVQEGPVTQIIRAEQAISILNVTGAVADQINKKNYGEVISTFQNLCIDQFVLSITKLYEIPREYALNSIPSVLDYFDNNKENLEITEPYSLEQQLMRLGLDLAGFEKLTNAEQNTIIYNELSRRSPSLQDNEALAALKTMRDKKIAHPEDINVQSLEKATWQAAEDLLQYPKDVVGVLGDGYLSTVYMLEDGEYLLTSDATRVGRGMKRMLKDLGIQAI